MEADLKVEHANCDFKFGLMHLAGEALIKHRNKNHINLAGNYTEEAIVRVAKATDVTKVLREKLNPHFTERYLYTWEGSLKHKIKFVVRTLYTRQPLDIAESTGRTS